jgi:dynein heavy chain 2
LLQDEISSWDSRLATLQDGLMLLNSIQRKWVYLQPLFARGALPAQQQRFKNVDTGFRALMVQLAVSLVQSFQIPCVCCCL